VELEGCTGQGVNCESLLEVRVGEGVVKGTDSGTLLASGAFVESSDLAELTLLTRSTFIPVVVLLRFVAFTEANPFVNILFLDGVTGCTLSAEIL
jgi:hypothetical protein